MADISALYPQPPQQQQQPNLLQQNPLNLLSTVSGLQTQALQREQLNLAINKDIYNAVSQGFGSMDTNSTNEDVYNRAANLMKVLGPRAAPAVQYWRNRITGGGPGTVAHGVSEAAIAGNPTAASTPALGPPDPMTGAQPYTTAAGNIYAGAPAQTPPSTDTGMTSPTVAGAVRVPTTTYRAPATTLGLGANESNQAMLADKAREASLPQDLYPWQQALSKMQELQAKGETFGPGSKGRQELESYAQTLAPSIAKWFGVDPSKVTGYAEVEKYLQQGLGTRTANFPHSNEGLVAASGGSPSVHVTDLAGVPLIKSIIALRRMEYAQTQQAAKNGGPGYLNAKAAIGSQLDPRAFSIDMMDPKQIQSLQKTLKGTERTKFNASLQMAIENGLITPPSR